MSGYRIVFMQAGWWLLRLIGAVCRLLVILWGAAAIWYWSVPMAWLVALAFIVLGSWALWIKRDRVSFAVFACAFLALVAYWISVRPRNDRDWSPDVAVAPRAEIEGDRVRITGFRNFDYRSRDDFTERWETREISLSKLIAVDFLVSYWTPEPGIMAHTFLSFVFEDAPPVCVSVEARKERGESYKAVRSMFKHYELAYVVGDERDIVRVRTDIRGEKVFLYRLRLTSVGMRRLFLDYLAGMNLLADHPQFYHLLSNNCTTNIQQHARAPGATSPFVWRILLNGLTDHYIYDIGGLDLSLPFEELKSRSFISPAAKEARNSEDFSRKIRAGLPAMETPLLKQ
jgi:hypothetical protein